MLQHIQKFIAAMSVFIISIGLLLGECSAATSTIRLVVNPNKTDVYLGSHNIALTARVRGKNLAYTWELLGPGKLDGKGSAVFYILPEKIAGESAQALITVKVTDESGQEMTESIIFNILARPAQSPSPTPTLPPSPEPQPTPSPQADSFSLDDLKEAAEQEERKKAGWQAKLQEMEKALLQIEDYEQRNISTNLKIAAWQRFIQVFSTDNPYSARDEELRRIANERIQYWQQGGTVAPTPMIVPVTPTPSSLPPTPTPVPLLPTPTPSEIKQLLKKADTYFDEQWFLTPENKNAFDVYQDVLRLDPANSHAREKLREMMTVYKRWGDDNYRGGQYSRAKMFYQRYLTIAQYVITDLGEQSISGEFQQVQELLSQLEAPPTPVPSPTPTVALPEPTPTPVAPIPTPKPTMTPIPVLKPTAIPQKSGTWTDPISGIEFVWIPGDCYQMGCLAKPRYCQGDEKPIHEVCLDGFWMGKYEITQQQWSRIMGENPSHFHKEKDAMNRPVDSISWNRIQVFLQKLNAKAGDNAYRLPSEAEWEYACRAGTRTLYSFGDDPGKLGEYGWHSKNSKTKNRPVGQLKPNGFGLYDMHGNAWEWCADAWHDNYDGAPSDGSAWEEKKNASKRVIRGGSWLDGAVDSRCANRLYGRRSSVMGGYTLGVRLVYAGRVQ